MKMEPTLHFRWAEREHVTYVNGAQGGAYPVAERVRVLQQGWAPSGGGHVEWRDVPVVPIAGRTKETP